MAAVRGLARALRAKVKEAATAPRLVWMGAAQRLIAQLGEGEAPAIADLRIVHAELVPVITERQRLRQIVRQRLEPAEMPRPAFLVQLEADAFGPALIDETRDTFGEARRLDSVVKFLP